LPFQSFDLLFHSVYFAQKSLDFVKLFSSLAKGDFILCDITEQVFQKSDSVLLANEHLNTARIANEVRFAGFGRSSLKLCSA